MHTSTTIQLSEYGAIATRLFLLTIRKVASPFQILIEEVLKREHLNSFFLNRKGISPMNPETRVVASVLESIQQHVVWSIALRHICSRDHGLIYQT